MRDKSFLQLVRGSFFKIGVFVAVLIFTFILRSHNFDRTPEVGHLEEMLYAWSGIYLIETGVPVSWSTLDYPFRAEIFHGVLDLQGKAPYAPVKLYKPWLDEPPLFSLLVGYFAHLYQADREDVIPSAFIRLPVVIISTLSSVMLFIIARMVSGYWTGILAMLVFGLTPVMVFASRLAVPENLIALLFLVTIYLLLKFYNKPQFIYLLPIPLLAGIGGLSKPTGFMILPIAIFFAFLHKRFKWSLYLLLATLPFVAAFFWYGLHFDAEIFWRITSIQAQRPVGFASLGWFFISPAFDINLLFDSWYIFCLLAAGYFIFAPKDGLARFISLFFAYWVIVVMLSGGEIDLLPWYRFPALPLMALMGAWGLQYLYKKADFFSSFIVAGMLLGNRYLLVNAFRPNVNPLEYRLIFSGLMIPPVLNFILNRDFLKTLNQIVLLGVLIVGAYFNVVYIYNHFDIICQSVDCPLGPSTSFSEIRLPFFWRLIDLE